MSRHGTDALRPLVSRGRADYHTRMSPQTRPGRPTPPGNADLEWIGARVQLPTYVLEPKPFRPEMILWLETPSDLVVGAKMIEPNTPPVALAETFLEAARKPLAGEPRRPRRVRVASRGLAAELAPLAAEGIVVHVAPTPEVDAFVEAMLHRTAGAARDDLSSYLEGGRVSEQTVADLFSAARYLWAVAPWKAMYDSQTLRCDIPAYGIRGACVSIIGNLGESFGVLVFPSQKAYEAFGRAQARSRRKGRIDLGTSLLSFEFDPAGSVPASMRREAETHGWRVSGPRAYRRVFHRDRDGTPRPLTQRDVELATACAMSVATFYVRNEPLLDPEARAIEPVSMTVENDAGVAVRFTYPYEAYDLFEREPPPRREPPPAARRIGRNDLCPCGSGKEYKLCHLEADERLRRAAQRGTLDERAAIHAEDERLVERMMAWASARFGRAQAKVAGDSPSAGGGDLTAPAVGRVRLRDRGPPGRVALPARSGRPSQRCRAALA